jgi:hypothetical protein
MTNEIVKIESNQLEKVLTESGLAIQEGEEIKKSYLPFLNQLAEIQSQATKINFDSPAVIDETIARELRLKTVKIRTGSKDLKDERKKGYLLRGNLEQAAYNLIEASCKLTEDVFVNVEKAREIAEKKRLEQLRIDRLEMLKPYTEIEPLALGHMEQTVFDNYLSGLKVAHEAKIEADKKAETERLAAIEAEKKRQEEIRLENERLKKEAVERERLAEIERKKQAEILAAHQAKADAERKAAEVERKRIEAENFRKLEIERREKERVQNELRLKQEAEEMAKQELQKKLAAEKKAKAAEERKQKLAPDRTKLLNFMQAINDLPRPEVKSIEAGLISTTANTMLVKVSNYIRDNANTL